MEDVSRGAAPVGAVDVFDEAEEALARVYLAQHEALQEMFAREVEAEVAGEALLSVTEVAKRLGVNPKTVRARMARREIPVYGTPRAPRMKWADVERCFRVRPVGHREPGPGRPARRPAPQTRRASSSRFQVRP